MNTSALISGIVLVVLGAVLIALGFTEVEEKVGLIVLLVYGLISLGLGFYILINSKKEDKIEGIRNKKSKDIKKR